MTICYCGGSCLDQVITPRPAQPTLENWKGLAGRCRSLVELLQRGNCFDHMAVNRASGPVLKKRAAHIKRQNLTMTANWN
jgi:hypothetical protein